MDKAKRQRSANISEADSKLLVRLANQFKDVLDNKKTDAHTNKSRTKCWVELTNLFNANTGGPERDAKVLRLKYECIKKGIRRPTCGTGGWKKMGGGPPNESLTPLNEEEKELRESIILSCDGIEVVEGCDSDFVEGQGVKGVNPNLIQRRVVSQPETLEVDWADYSPAMLKTPVHPLLAEASSAGVMLEPDEKERIPEKSGHDSCEVPPSISMTPRSTLRKELSSRRRVVLKRASRASATSYFEEVAKKKSRLLDDQLEMAAISKKILECQLLAAQADLRMKLLQEEQGQISK